jgi:hypothetical protein
MLDENVKAEIDKITKTDILETTDRIYKPSYTIEFDRIGEVLLYSCDPIQHVAVYFKYPYVLYESAMPAALFMWVFNPIDLPWYIPIYKHINNISFFFLTVLKRKINPSNHNRYWNNGWIFLMNMLWIPRLWYLRSLNYKIRRLSLLRGGKVAKIETSTLAGDRFTSWIETYQLHPLTAD